MKDFITAVASVLVLMIFLIQFFTNEMTFVKLMTVEESVKRFQIVCEEKKTLEEHDVDRLKHSLSETLNCSEEEIKIAPPSNEEGAISFYIDVPIKGVIGAAKVLGIEEEKNVMIHRMNMAIDVSE